MSKIKNFAIGLGILASTGAAFLPAVAFAEDVTGSDGSTIPDATEDLDVNVLVNTVISMTIKSYSGSTPTLNGTTDCTTSSETGATESCTTTGTQKVEATILPGEEDLTSMYSDIFVSTNSVNGFSLKLIDADENTSLVNGSYTIPTVSSRPAGASASTPNPGWAVSLDGGTTWLAMPNGGSQDGTVAPGTAITVDTYSPATPAAVTDRQSTVHYGVATSSSQAAGTYTDTVVYTATAL